MSGILDLGYIWAIADKRRQGWHDKLAGSIVLKVDAFGNPIPRTQPIPSAIKRWSLFMLAALLFMAIPVLILAYLFLGWPVQVKGQAMAPNYQDGEYYVVKKFGFGYLDFKRGDVVVFEEGSRNVNIYIKRIVGLPGEAIKIENGQVFIDGQLLHESYISTGMRTSGGQFLHEGQEYTLGKDECFVLGDNRDRSSDSRSWGPIKWEKIEGKVWFKYWGK